MWRVVFIVTLALLFVVLSVLAFLVVQWVLNKWEEKKERTTCVFEKNRRNINFISLGASVIVSTKTISVDEPLRIDVATNELVCFGNV